MGGGLTGVQDILSRDFIMYEDDISISETPKGFIAKDNSSNFIFLHDFGAKNSFFNNFKDAQNALNLNKLNSLKKYEYLGNKTREVLSSNFNIGLVYFGFATKDVFKNVHSMFTLKYMREFEIINVLDKKDTHTVTDGTVLNLFVDDSSGPQIGTSREWEGWAESWKNALSKIKYS